MDNPFMQPVDAGWDALPRSINLWVDPIPRKGWYNMAADEVLSLRPEAWLRIYGWALPAVSFGYFDTATEAAKIFPAAQEYIRRWTGGGIVDHRSGYTYTVTLPAREGVVYPMADQLYLWIHGALAKALAASGVPCTLLTEDAPSGGRACWASPVKSDIVDAAGQKLAGAGQRRRKGAVLHQGLVQECTPAPGWERLLAQELAPQVIALPDGLAEPFAGFDAAVHELVESKYATAEWNDETHGRRKPGKA